MSGALFWCIVFGVAGFGLGSAASWRRAYRHGFDDGVEFMELSEPADFQAAGDTLP